MTKKILLGALVATAAALPATAAHAQSIVPAPKVVKAGANGKTVSIVEGQELHIRLQECLTCGYRWLTREKPDARVLRRLPKRTTNPCKPPCTGGVNTTTFRYAGRTAGRTTLRMVYLPPGSEKPAKTFRLTVRVRDAG